MKIEQLIVQHLYNAKKVSIQDIGTFYLSPDIQTTADSDKEISLPDNAIRFEFNKKAQPDEDLINFIVEHSRKIKPLASSDLESYSLLARQFLNIGKPFPIEGLGVLVKSQSGDYEFLQGHTVNTKLESAPIRKKEKNDEEISFSAVDNIPKNNRNTIMILVACSILATGAILFYLLNKNNKSNLEQVTVSDSTHIKDSLSNRPDSVLNVPATVTPDSTIIKNSGDSASFKVVVKEYTGRQEAQKALSRFSSFGHSLLLYSLDSAIYRLSIPFTLPLSDTAHVRDSLKIIFGGQPYVDQTKY